MFGSTVEAKQVSSSGIMLEQGAVKEQVDFQMVQVWRNACMNEMKSEQEEMSTMDRQGPGVKGVRSASQAEGSVDADVERGCDPRRSTTTTR